MDQQIQELMSKYRVATQVAKSQAQQEMKSRVLELTTPERQELSIALHDAHAQGTPKHVLRSITGMYNNASQWDPVWDEWVPETPVDLRRKDSETLDKPGHRWDEDTLVILLDSGSEVPMTRAELHSEGEETWASWSAAEDFDESDYPEIDRKTTQALTSEGGES